MCVDEVGPQASPITTTIITGTSNVAFPLPLALHLRPHLRLLHCLYTIGFLLCKCTAALCSSHEVHTCRRLLYSHLSQLIVTLDKQRRNVDATDYS